MATGLQNSHSTLFQDAIKNGFQSFINTSSLMTATTATGTPAAGTFYSSIVGRASMVDLSKDLRVSLGVDRIVCQQTIALQNEFGTNGEQVFSISNDDRGLVRLVGTWSSEVASIGENIQTSTSNDYMEVTFYGTGLNLLAQNDALTRALTVSIDGGAAGSNILLGTSNVITGRNYAPNQVVNAATGLALGVHTAKITNTGNGIRLYGIEILNGSASTLNVNAGTAYIDGLKTVLSTSAALAYNANVTGTKGGRQVAYLTSAGTLSTAFTPVNTSALYTTNATHTNEEVVRQYSPREFGAGRSDDFSNSGILTRAFTLDDGTTTLTSDSCNWATYSGGREGLYAQGNSNFIDLYFVGCGIDVGLSGSAAVADTYSVSIDGGSNGSVTCTTAFQNTKLASGLPYGSHVLRLTRANVNGNGPVVVGFTVYQPKKPSIPSGAIELADFNVMATFVANTLFASQLTVATGVLKKHASREFTYVNGTGGSNWGISFQVPTRVGGISLENTDTNGYFEYTFFGTGFDLRWRGEVNRTTNATITIKDSSGTYKAFTSANFAGVTCGTLGGASVTYGGSNGSFALPATNTFSQVATATSGCSFSANGLALGVYTLRVTNGSGLNVLDIETIDVITPVHVAKSNLYGDLQSTLPVGSCSLTDSRKTTAIKETLPVTKAWAQAFGIATSPSTTSTALVPMPDMQCTIKTSGGTIEIKWEADIAFSASSEADMQLYVDGNPVGNIKQFSPNAASIPYFGFSGSLIVPATAGTHIVQLFWSSPGGQTITARSAIRNMSVREI